MPHKIKVCYIAHPVGKDPERKAKNIAKTKAWFKLLIEVVPEIAFTAPWLPYVETLDEDTHRERGIRDDLEMLSRCDLIGAVGMDLRYGPISIGVMAEWNRAHELGLACVDLDEPYQAAYLASEIVSCDACYAQQYEYRHIKPDVRKAIRGAFAAHT